MPIAVVVSLISSVAAIVFTAGGLYYSFNRLKKDVDGVGRKVNKLHTDQLQLKIAVLLLSPDEAREFITNYLRDG